MSEDVYRRLRAHLDRLPGGFPETESGVELKLLKKLFTPEEAELAMKLTPFPETPGNFAKRVGLDEKEAAARLESLARQGSILRARIRGQAMYAALSFVVGIYEFHLNTIDRELAELMEEYMPYLAGAWTKTKTKQLRVVPLAASLPGNTKVNTYNDIRELVKHKELISVARCICTKEQELMGEPCQRPEERCIQFDLAAQYYIENGMARQISKEELLDLLKMGEEQALVLNTTGAKEILNICMCCGCCCGALRMLKKMERPADHVMSAYQAWIDPELCSACGTCEERCQVDAIKDGEVYVVEQGRCIGCGLCVPTCPEEAISLKERQDPPSLPANIVEMNLQIAKERGVM